MKSRVVTLVIALVGLQACVAFFLIKRRSNISATDQRISAQLGAEFEKQTEALAVSWQSLEKISQEEPVMISLPFSNDLLGREHKFEGVVRVIQEDKQVDCIGKILATTLVTNVDLQLGQFQASCKQVCDSFVVKSNDNFWTIGDSQIQTVVNLTSDKWGKLVKSSGFTKLNGVLLDSPVTSVPLFFPERGLAIGTQWSIKPNSNLIPASSSVSRAEAKLVDFVSFESHPCAVVEAFVDSTQNPQEIFGKVASVVPNESSKRLNVVEHRLYLVRLKDAEVLWCEFKSQAKSVSSTFRLKLASL